MKKLYTLVLALMVTVSVSAQSTGKNGSGTNSTGQKSVYRSSGSSSTVSSRSSSQTSSSKKTFTQNTGTNQKSLKQNSSFHTEKTTFKQAKVTPVEKTIQLKEEAKKEEKVYSIKNSDIEFKGENKENSPGITTVNRGPEYPSYEEKEKGKYVVDYSQPSTAVDHEQNNSSIEVKDTMNYGLSATKTTFENNGIRPKNHIVTCDEMRLNRNSRLGILKSYEQYDLSQVRRCFTDYPVEDMWVVTCDEFERSSYERKLHILTNGQFYNIKAIENCNSYLEFRKSFKSETED